MKKVADETKIPVSSSIEIIPNPFYRARAIFQNSHGREEMIWKFNSNIFCFRGRLRSKLLKKSVFSKTLTFRVFVGWEDEFGDNISGIYL